MNTFCVVKKRNLFSRRMGVMLMIVALIVTSIVMIPPSQSAYGVETVSAVQPQMKTSYTAPAQDWESEALPLGNGYSGLMVFGGVDSDQLLINEKNLWSGGPGANAAYNGGFNSRTSAQNVEDWRSAQTSLQSIWNAATPASKNPTTGVVAPATWNISQMSTVSATVNRLKGQKNNFGSYQQLSNIYIKTPGTSAPVVVRSYCAQQHPTNGGEQVGSLFDGSTGTKMYCDGFANAPWVIEWDYGAALDTLSYRIGSGNDSPTRDPQNWIIEASNDEGSTKTWTTVSAIHNAGSLAARSTYYTYNLDVPGSYKYWRMTVSKTAGNTNLQLSEIEVLPNIPAPDPYTNYKRELDIDNSIAKVSYTRNNVDYAREYFVSYPNNFQAVRLTASGTGKISEEFSITTPQTRSTVTAATVADGAAVMTLTGWPSDHNKTGAVTDFSGTLHFAQQVKIIPTGGMLSVDGNKVTVIGADSVLVYSATDTNYQQCMDDTYNYFDGIDPLTKVQSRMDTISTRTWDQLYAAHLADYKELYDRVKVNLNHTTASLKATNTLLSQYNGRGNTSSEDRYLEALYYQFGRYLLISSSREGSLPANLQGVWAAGTSPPWSADYHTNINVQMNYWPAWQTNLAETAVPVLKYTQSLVPRGREAAKFTFGANVRGWTIWHENNIWGNAAPATSDAFYSPEDAAWLAQTIWEHYEFTRDEQFLKENYKLLMDAALFWVDTLYEDTRDNTLVVNPSYSPEHGPYALGATESQAVVWGMFDEVQKATAALGTIAASTAYGSDVTSLIDEINTSKSRLSGPKIGLGGQFQEWKDEIDQQTSLDLQHRHVNHLFPLHPGNQIVAGRSDQENKFVEAMKVTLNTRGDGGTGWSKAWKVNFWARLRDGDHSQKMFRELLTQSTLPNLFDTHSPFQIDGNFGGTAGVTEMFLQSQGDAIELLPALPSNYAAGAISGLVARGNVVVGMEWHDNALDAAELNARTAGTIRVKYPNIQSATVKSGGAPVSFTTVDLNTIEITATAGQSFYISDIEELVTPKDAYSTISAITADALNGNVYKTATDLADSDVGDYALFKSVDFGSDGAVEAIVQSYAASATPQSAVGTIEFRLDSPTNEPFAVITGFKATGHTTLFAPVNQSVTGMHNMYVIFTGKVNLKSIKFAKTTSSETATAVSLAGESMVTIPGLTGSALDVKYSANVTYDTRRVATNSENIVWTLGGDFQGVKLSDSGVLTVKPLAVRQDIDVTATLKSDSTKSSTIRVSLVDGVVTEKTIRLHDRNAEGVGSDGSQHMTYSNSNYVEHTASGGWLKFNNVDLRDGLVSISMTYASPTAYTGSNPRYVQIFTAEPGTTDSANYSAWTGSGKTQVANIDARALTGGWSTLLQTAPGELMNAGNASGVKDLYVYWPRADFNPGRIIYSVIDKRSEQPTLSQVQFSFSTFDTATFENGKVVLAAGTSNPTADISVMGSDGYSYRSLDKTIKLSDGDFTYVASNNDYFSSGGAFTVPFVGSSVSTQFIKRAPVDSILTQLKSEAEINFIPNKDIYISSIKTALVAAYDQSINIIAKATSSTFAEVVGAAESLAEIKARIEANDGLDAMRVTDAIKYMLKTYINSASSLNAVDYTSSTWSRFNTAFVKFKAIVDDTNDRSLAEATNSLNEMLAAKDELVYIKNLKDLVATADALDANDYDSESAVKAFKDSLAVAKTVLANSGAAQSAVNGAIAALEPTIAPMKASIKNWSYLNGVVIAAEKTEQDIQSGKYLEIGVFDFLEALDSAKLLQSKPGSSQQAIDAATSKLLETIGKLVTFGKADFLATVNGVTALFDKDIANLLSADEFGDFLEAYEKAVSVLYDPNASQTDIEVTIDELKNILDPLGLVTADTTALQKAVKDGEDMKSADYSDAELFATYMSAHNAAVALLDDPSTLQVEADKAIATLQVAKAALNSKQKSSASLTLAISTYKNQIESLRRKYVASDVDFFATMIASAEKIATATDSTQSQIDTALANLHDMRATLRVLANKTVIVATIARAEKIVQKYYTSKSLINFKGALTNAKLVNANMNLGKEDQSIINTANQQLKASIEKLVYNVTSMKLAKRPSALKKGKTFKLNVKVAPAEIQKQVKLTYKTSDRKVATVDGSGKVTAKKKGVATITVTAPNGKKLNIKITVK